MADDPELPTNDEWRGMMVRARKERGWSQKELGDKVRTSQNVISLIESGGVTSSTFVLAICRALSIPEPVQIADEEDRDWYNLGRLLRTKHPRLFSRELRSVKELLAELERIEGKDGEEPGRGDETTRPRK